MQWLIFDIKNTQTMYQLYMVNPGITWRLETPRKLEKWDILDKMYPILLNLVLKHCDLILVDDFHNCYRKFKAVMM